MPEGTIELPPNSTGTSIRTEVGDGASNMIPLAVAQEVVTLADANGYLHGDKRMGALKVNDADALELLRMILTELEATRIVLEQAFKIHFK